jgi:hypothetical protein
VPSISETFDRPPARVPGEEGRVGEALAVARDEPPARRDDERRLHQRVVAAEARERLGQVGGLAFDEPGAQRERGGPWLDALGVSIRGTRQLAVVPASGEVSHRATSGERAACLVL